MAGKGVWGMIGVDLIGQIRRAYFEQRRPIKEIVRGWSRWDNSDRFPPSERPGLQ
jgi:hypothetical protein